MTGMRETFMLGILLELLIGHGKTLFYATASTQGYSSHLGHPYKSLKVLFEENV